MKKLTYAYAKVGGIEVPLAFIEQGKTIPASFVVTGKAKLPIDEKIGLEFRNVIMGGNQIPMPYTLKGVPYTTFPEKSMAVTNKEQVNKLLASLIKSSSGVERVISLEDHKKALSGGVQLSTQLKDNPTLLKEKISEGLDHLIYPIPKKKEEPKPENKEPKPEPKIEPKPEPKVEQPELRKTKPKPKEVSLDDILNDNNTPTPVQDTTKPQVMEEDAEEKVEEVLEEDIDKMEEIDQLIKDFENEDNRYSEDELKALPNTLSEDLEKITVLFKALEEESEKLNKELYEVSKRKKDIEVEIKFIENRREELEYIKEEKERQKTNITEQLKSIESSQTVEEEEVTEPETVEEPMPEPKPLEINEEGPRDSEFDAPEVVSVPESVEIPKETEPITDPIPEEKTGPEVEDSVEELSWEGGKATEEPKEEPKIEEPETNSETRKESNLVEILGLDTTNPMNMVNIREDSFFGVDYDRFAKIVDDIKMSGDEIFPGTNEDKMLKLLEAHMSLPGHNDHVNIPLLIQRIFIRFGDYRPLYDMVKIKLKSEFIKPQNSFKLYHGYPYPQFLYLLARVKFGGVEYNSKQFVDEATWIVETMSSNRMIYIAGEDEESADAGSSRTVWNLGKEAIDQSTNNTARGGVALLMEDVFNEVHGRQIKGHRLVGHEIFQYMYTVSRSGGEVRVKSPMTEIVGLGEILVKLDEEDGFIVSDRLRRPLNIYALGLMSFEWAWSRDKSNFDLTYDDALLILQNLEDYRDELGVMEFDPVGKLDDIHFQPINLVRVGTSIKNRTTGESEDVFIPAPFFVVGKDMSPEVTPSKRHVLLPIMGNYLKEVKEYVKFDYDVKFNQINNIPMLKDLNFRFSNSTIKYFQGNNKTFEDGKMDFVNQITSKSFDFTGDVVKSLSVKYPGLYIPEAAMEDIKIYDKYIAKSMSEIIKKKMV